MDSNLETLIHKINSLEGDYVSKSEVLELILSYKETQCTGGRPNKLKNLDMIYLREMKEANMSKKVMMNELGICRTTLWRALNLLETQDS